LLPLLLNIPEGQSKTVDVDPAATARSDSCTEAAPCVDIVDALGVADANDVVMLLPELATVIYTLFLDR